MAPEKTAELRSLIVRMGMTRQQDTLPDDSEIGSMHWVAEASTEYVQYARSRLARYVGGGRWEVSPGSHTIWREDGGAVHHWFYDSKTLRERSLALIDAEA